jgi:hypothetical protein
MSILNPDTESRLEDQYWKTIGGDVVCPPDPTARCGHCDLTLEDHTTLDPVVTPENAICLDDASLLVSQVVWNRFVLAPGQNFDCRAVTVCTVCCVSICSEHSDEFVACAENEHDLHHVVCRDHCDADARAIAAERAFEQNRDVA